LFFLPENEEDLVRQIRQIVENPGKLIDMGNNARSYVSTHFNRDKIALDFLKLLEHNL
jgi:glycosyltransferase involved in cell wall biosynthesis